LSNGKATILNHCANLAQSALGSRCLLCAAPAPDSTVCAGCHADLPRLPAPVCDVCAIPISSGTTCGRCIAHPPHFDRTHAPCAYAYPLDRVIQRFKYGGDLSAARVLAQVMLEATRTAPRPDVIVPMPLARERLAERGFNQSLEIARLVGAALGIPVAHDACVRVQHAPPQAALPWKERAKNVRGAFVCTADLSGKAVAVVDDVLTTGATLNELARVLKKRGATAVAGWVTARTLATR
jgi:ComF family protein